MNEQDLFILADTTLLGIVNQIRSDQWSMTMPPEFPTWDPNATMTLREVVNYHAYDDAWVPDTLAGKTIEEVGSAHDGDLLGDDPKGSFARYVDAAVAAVRDLDDLDRPVHLSYGDFSAREYLWHITSFRGLRVHDIAKAIGVDSTLPSDLTQGLWGQIAPHAEEWRAMGVFGPKVDVPESAPLQDRLLGLTGRQP
jgi:uncharacterized protein (TIGR03086 family)